MNGIDGALVQNEPTIRRKPAFGREVQVMIPVTVECHGIPRPVEVIPHAFGECAADPIILLYRPERARCPNSTEARRFLCCPVQIFGHHIPAVQNTQNQGQRDLKRLLVAAEGIVVHADPVDAHLDHPVALKGFKETIQVAVDGRIACQSLLKDFSAHDEAPAAPVNSVEGAYAYEFAICSQLDENIALVGIGGKVTLSELIHGRDPAPFVRIVSENQASFSKAKPKSTAARQ